MVTTEKLSATQVVEEFRKLGTWTDFPFSTFKIWPGPEDPRMTPAQLFEKVIRIAEMRDADLAEKVLRAFGSLAALKLSERGLADFTNILEVYMTAQPNVQNSLLSDFFHISTISLDEREFNERWRRLDAGRILRVQAIVAPRDRILENGGEPLC
jgi:hypothetical protein